MENKPTWEEIASTHWRANFIDRKYEPFKIYGNINDILDGHPRMLDEHGNPTERLSGLGSNSYNGSVKRICYPEVDEETGKMKPSFVIFNPKAGDFDKIETFMEIERISELLAEFAYKYHVISKKKIDCKQYRSISTRLNTIYRDFFGIARITKDNKDFPKYCEVGALFAQGFIKKKENLFFYKDTEFASAYKLSQYLKDEVLKTDSSIKQYIQDTLSDYGKPVKDFYSSKKMMGKIIEYCESRNTLITEEFTSIYHDLQTKHQN